MYDVNGAASDGASDPLSVQFKLAGLEPVSRWRASGSLHLCTSMGRMEFCRMPHGRPSYWRSRRRMTDAAHFVQVVCEVERDRVPGADHAACFVALRRRETQEARAAAPLINRRLSEMQLSIRIGAADLVMTAIHLPAHPLTQGYTEVSFRAITAPELIFTVVHLRGRTARIRIDSDA